MLSSEHIVPSIVDILTILGIRYLNLVLHLSAHQLASIRSYGYRRQASQANTAVLLGWRKPRPQGTSLLRAQIIWMQASSIAVLSGCQKSCLRLADLCAAAQSQSPSVKVMCICISGALGIMGPMTQLDLWVGCQVTVSYLQGFGNPGERCTDSHVSSIPWASCLYPCYALLAATMIVMVIHEGDQGNCLFRLMRDTATVISTPQAQ